MQAKSGREPGSREEQQHRRDVECITHAIDSDVIPRLALRLRAVEAAAVARPAAPAKESPRPVVSDVERFLDQVLAGQASHAELTIAALRESGWSVEKIFLDLLKPAARRIGEMWCDDRIDFALATVALGQMQRMMRDLSAAFAAEAEAAAHAHRALFVQAIGEQHSFGLSMLAEFFRRAGWDVVGGVGGAVQDPVERVRREWVDMVGFSIGSEPNLARLLDVIRAVRGASMNPDLVVMVGGPLFDAHPELIAVAGADAAAADARQALTLAERMVAERQRRRP